jgi:hypothetical protein
LDCFGHDLKVEGGLESWDIDFVDSGQLADFKSNRQRKLRDVGQLRDEGQLLPTKCLRNGGGTSRY